MWRNLGMVTMRDRHWTPGDLCLSSRRWQPALLCPAQVAPVRHLFIRWLWTSIPWLLMSPSQTSRAAR